ncbi:MAG: class I SAM-dependent methyltransferase [Bacteroidetes bacterium]|nr:class I SAM-dependent methyltransferase [Bacteroidota bacterium]
MKCIKTAERVSKDELSDNFVYQRSLFAYQEAAKIISGKVLEIGTGTGYGIQTIAQYSQEFITIDKNEVDIPTENNVEFIKMNVPPLINIPDNYFDFVISFQIIEHIKEDNEFVNEIYRVLKPAGKLIITTPNKSMSLTRNPWHVREYFVHELDNILSQKFNNVDKLGVYANKKVMDFHNINKEYVRKITRFDVFNLQYRLPRQLLQIPYDFANRLNKKKVLSENLVLLTGITLNDFYLSEATNSCFDLFFVAEKKPYLNATTGI